MQTFDVAVVVAARVHGTSLEDAESRLMETVRVEIGSPGGPLKRAIGMHPPGADAFIQVAQLHPSRAFVSWATDDGVFAALGNEKRDMS